MPPCHKANSSSIVADTKVYFYGVLEVGMATFAINLPSSWFLISKITPESVVRSIRSMISLQSIRSGGSRGSRKDTSPKSTDYAMLDKKKDNASSTSQTYLAEGDHVTNESYATWDEEANKNPTLPATVHITKTVSQKSERV